MAERLNMDHDLGMVREAVKTSDMNHLRELRWRAERGYFGPKPLSVPKGDNVFRLTDSEIRHYAMIQANTELKPQPASNYEQTIQ